jgi:hypothetical protein
MHRNGAGVPGFLIAALKVSEFIYGWLRLFTK